jgi:hypothetical protein
VTWQVQHMNDETAKHRAARDATPRDPRHAHYRRFSIRNRERLNRWLLLWRLPRGRITHTIVVGRLTLGREVILGNRRMSPSKCVDGSGSRAWLSGDDQHAVFAKHH